MGTQRIRVALLVGGDSSEREVSLASGHAMANALPADRFAVTMYDVASPATRAAAGLGVNTFGYRPRHACLPVEWNQLTTTLYTSGFDVVLPALHGGKGEDGTLQALLDVAGIPYVGSGMRASVVALDKQLCKALVAECGIRAPRGVVVGSLAAFDAMKGELPFPCVVKPNAGGSSVATTLLREGPSDAAGRRGLIRQAVEAALADGNGALIEALIAGAEVTAAVLGEGERAQVLPLLQIVPKRGEGFFDYTAKYTEGGAEHLIPPHLPEAIQEELRAAALLIHRKVGCRGVSRSDFMVTEDGAAYFLEINTLPGMTELSLVPDCARAAGISFAALLERLIEQTISKRD